MHVDSCDTEKIGQWEMLPDTCLLHTFKYLSDDERSKAALVCHHWHNIMRMPCLWRCRSFHFSGHRSLKPSEYVAAKGYAENLGVFLESLEVTVCPPRSMVVAQRLHSTICALLNALVRVKAPLKSLSILRLELDRSSWDRGLRNVVVDKLIYFLLRSASRLNNICLNGMRIGTELGLELISAIIQNQRSLSPLCGLSLDLRGFFSNSVPNHLNLNIPHMLQQLQGLTHLGLSYSCLSDELLLALSQSNRARRYKYGRGNILQRFSLFCTQNEPHQQVVQGYSWATLMSSCPDLKVILTVEQVIDSQQLSLTLDLSNRRKSLDDELLELVNVCECLIDLRIWAFLDVRTVGRLLHIRLTKKMSLNKIRVRIYTMAENIEEQEYQLKEVLSPFCYPPELQFLAVICPFI
ncbi:F-box only protein 39-like isoform X2 [Girardinichthys multiradiatus]|uniref:F-box only protein 39-like isoform X2 n=1 Tax=Girardinichthys multiradiatus TaxID=208333 RepID=UPI001FAD62A0|nr:F-box only protein 39-like isoform X2 [Girardinichthys multiradiatus]